VRDLFRNCRKNHSAIDSLSTFSIMSLSACLGEKGFMHMFNNIDD
jgi:hypothetical protein